MPNLISQKRKYIENVLKNGSLTFHWKVSRESVRTTGYRSPAAAAEPPLHMWATETQSQTVKLHIWEAKTS